MKEKSRSISMIKPDKIAHPKLYGKTQVCVSGLHLLPNNVVF